MKPDLKFWLFIIGLAVAFVALVPAPKVFSPAAVEVMHWIAAGVYFVLHGAYAMLVKGEGTLPDPPVIPTGRKP